MPFRLALHPRVWFTLSIYLPCRYSTHPHVLSKLSRQMALTKDKIRMLPSRCHPRLQELEHVAIYNGLVFEVRADAEWQVPLHLSNEMIRTHIFVLVNTWFDN